MATIKPTVIKQQMKLRYVMVRAPADLGPSIQPSHRYSSLSNFPREPSPTRPLGAILVPRSESESRKQTERDFLLLRQLVELGEFQRPDKKIPFKSRRQLAREEATQTTTSPQRSKTRQKSKSTAPGRFNFSQVKRISIADFKRNNLPGFVSFVCKRKEQAGDLLERTRSVHCDVFGPGLCPDCQTLENRYDFTMTQKDLFPFLNVNSRSLVAAPKLKHQPTPYFSEGQWHLSDKRTGSEALGYVYTEKDVFRRKVLDNDSNKTVNVLYC